METTRQKYDRLTRMSEELARMQREFIVKMLKENGDRLEVDRKDPGFICDAHVEASTFDGEEMVPVDYIRMDGDRLYWGGTTYLGDRYEDDLFPSAYDEIMRAFLPNFIK